jgi:hypothetical protein
MRCLKAIAGVGLVALTGAVPTQVRCTSHVIRNTGVGPLRVGQTVSSIRQGCRVVRDTIPTAMRVEEIRVHGC